MPEPDDRIAPAPASPAVVPDPTTSGERQRYSVLSNRAIGWAATVLIVIGVGLTAGLLVAFGDGRHPQQLDAIKTAGTIVIGTGGAAALWLTARRQQTSEIALNQKHADQLATERTFAFQQQLALDQRAHLDRVAAATEADAEARRITDLYTKAVEQLGSDKAPVRLGGLYALRRLAQDNAEQRQTIVDVICAYLRMPYTQPSDRALADIPESERVLFESRTQERQVRLTAQRILTTHLNPGVDPEQPADTFWPDIDVDLTGAILIDLDLTRCHFHTGRFSEAEFAGNAWFEAVEFAGAATFDRAKFTGGARFDRAMFIGTASFCQTEFADAAGFDRTKFASTAQFQAGKFTGTANFYQAEFAGTAGFDQARFGRAWFREAKFTGTATFGQAKFDDVAVFAEAKFAGTAWFHETKFDSGAAFQQVTFGGSTRFGQAKFTGNAQFHEARFIGDTQFHRAEFTGEVGFDGTGSWVRLDVPDIVATRCFWPAGWVVEPGGDRPASSTEGKWGRLVLTAQAT